MDVPPQHNPLPRTHQKVMEDLFSPNDVAIPLFALILNSRQELLCCLFYVD